MTSPDLTAANIEKVAELFPSVITESFDADGNPVRAVDFDLLRQELSDHVVEGPQERYQLDWPGKRAAAFAANAPIAKTLRPVREESVDFDTTKNLFIEGDNLDALKLLQESYLGKVKLIYIDPPYNTGNDFVYEDDFAESIGSVKPDRTDEDLLFQVLLDWGLDLAEPIEVEEIAGRRVLSRVLSVRQRRCAHQCRADLPRGVTRDRGQGDLTR
jgi:adenine specific DNA methylase Mod